MSTCWFCGAEFLREESQLIINCPGCGVDNDFSPYTPPEQKEEEVGKLKDCSKEHAKYIKIEDGESYEGVFEGWKEGVNMNGDWAVIYTIDNKEFKSSSAVLANTMDSIPAGTRIRISRVGEARQTKWNVEKL